MYLKQEPAYKISPQVQCQEKLCLVRKICLLLFIRLNNPYVSCLNLFSLTPKKVRSKLSSLVVTSVSQVPGPSLSLILLVLKVVCILNHKSNTYSLFTVENTDTENEKQKTIVTLKPYCRFSGYTIPTTTPTLLLLFDCQKEKLTQTYAGKGIFVFLLPILGSLAGTLQIRLTKDRLTKENKVLLTSTTQTWENLVRL